MLLVEDDASIREVTALGLEQAGFRVAAAADGRDGLARFREGGFDVVVLDVMLPELDGLAVLREIRSASRVPVRDALGQGGHGRRGRRARAGRGRLRDEAVRARASSSRGSGPRCARAEPPNEEVLAVGDVEIEPAGFRVRKRGEEIALTATEFRLLLELARRPRQVFTRELLLERVWNYDYLGDSRLVDVAVQRLRAKLEDDPKQPTLIVTVRGVGYRLGSR